MAILIHPLVISFQRKTQMTVTFKISYFGYIIIVTSKEQAVVTTEFVYKVTDYSIDTLRYTEKGKSTKQSEKLFFQETNRGSEFWLGFLK